MNLEVKLLIQLQHKMPLAKNKNLKKKLDNLEQSEII